MNCFGRGLQSAPTGAPPSHRTAYSSILCTHMTLHTTSWNGWLVATMRQALP